MTSNVDRPTAVASALEAVQTHTFEHTFEEQHDSAAEQHDDSAAQQHDCTGGSISRHGHTQQNRLRREGKFNKVRNQTLQRWYDGLFYMTYGFCATCLSFVRPFLRRKMPALCAPIRPYRGGELNGWHAVPLLVSEAAGLLSTIFLAVLDAIMALCDVPELPQSPQQAS